MRSLGHLLLQNRPSVLQGVKLADILGELVVNPGTSLALDLVDLDLEHKGLPGQPKGCSLREGNVDSFSSPPSCDELVFKTGHEAAGADLQIKVLTRTTVESHAVVEASKSMLAVSFFSRRAQTPPDACCDQPFPFNRALTSAAMTLTSAVGSLQALYWPSCSDTRRRALEGDAFLAAVLQNPTRDNPQRQLLFPYGAS